LAANGATGAPSAGTIVAFTTLQSRLFFPLGQLLNIQVELQGSLALFDRIFEYLEMDPEIVDAPDAVAMTPTSTRGKVRFRDVSFQYPTAAVPSQRAHEALARGVEGEELDDLDGRDGFDDAEWATEPEVAAVTASTVDSVNGSGAERRAGESVGLDGAACDRSGEEGASDDQAEPTAKPFGLDHIEFEAAPGEL